MAQGEGGINKRQKHLHNTRAASQQHRFASGAPTPSFSAVRCLISRHNAARSALQRWSSPRRRHRKTKTTKQSRMQRGGVRWGRVGGRRSDFKDYGFFLTDWVSDICLFMIEHHSVGHNIETIRRQQRCGGINKQSKHTHTSSLLASLSPVLKMVAVHGVLSHARSYKCLGLTSHSRRRRRERRANNGEGRGGRRKRTVSGVSSDRLRRGNMKW